MKTLPPAIFDKIDKLASPHLVEYWEQDPCNPVYPEEMLRMATVAESIEEDGAAGSAEKHGMLRRRRTNH